MFAPHPAGRAEPFRSVLFPTDLHKDGLPAFAHALRVALDGGCKLTLLHVGPGRDVPWERFPGIRDTLARWGVLRPAATRKELGDLGLRARKVSLDGGSAVRGILQRTRKSGADLVVLATRRRAGLSRWINPSVAESVIRQTRATSLVLPGGKGGFVDPNTGRVSLTRILVPGAEMPDTEVTLDAIARLLNTLGLPEGRVRVLRVGHRRDSDLPDGWPEGWTVDEVVRDGPVLDAILSEAEVWGADLVAMATHGHDEAIDQLRGSTTERVVRRLEVPLLVVPGPR